VSEASRGYPRRGGVGNDGTANRHSIILNAKDHAANGGGRSAAGDPKPRAAFARLSQFDLAALPLTSGMSPRRRTIVSNGMRVLVATRWGCVRAVTPSINAVRLRPTMRALGAATAAPRDVVVGLVAIMGTRKYIPQARATLCAYGLRIS
jgi:hypothetical protein